MGLVYANLVLKNAKADKNKAIAVNALVDSGSFFLCLPEQLSKDLELEELEKRRVKLANGLYEEHPYVGPVELKFQDRSCFVGALVMGDQVLLGAIPMEDLDVTINPLERKLIPANQARV